jgi:hypothetical protein
LISKPIILIKIGEKTKFFTPEQISAMVLGKMREIAQRPFFIFVSLSSTNNCF